MDMMFVGKPLASTEPCSSSCGKYGKKYTVKLKFYIS